MASKLVPLNEAAAQLGVSPDELNEMRSRQEIYGYRDGASWKFKQDDLDKLKASRAGGGSGLGLGSGLGSGIDFASASSITFDTGSGILVDTGSGTGSGTGSAIIVDTGSGPDIQPKPAGDALPIDSGGSEEIVLLSEVELGASPETTSSTIIGQSKQKPPSDSDLKTRAPAPVETDKSDVVLAPSDDDVLALGSASELPIDLADSKTVVKSTGSDAKKGGPLSGLGSDLSLAPESDIMIKGDSSLRLDDDSEDVLGGSGGSDLTHRPSDSGILLVDPADSGLSLDRPLDLTGSDPRLGATTEFSTAESAELEVKGDDDFLLTPLEESTEDDSDSGSQVIMLDTEGEFDDATATLLASQIPGMEGMLAVEEPSTATMGAEAMMGAGPTTARGPVQTVVVGVREAPFSALSVMGLAACTLFLAVAGTMMYDLVRNMWSWNSAYGTSSMFMDALIGK